MPPAKHHRHIGAYVVLLAVISVVVAWWYFFEYRFSSQGTQSETERMALPEGFPQVVPPPTKSDYVSAQSDFQHLVSITAGGIMPASLSIKRGETVRFTNNGPSETMLTFNDIQESPRIASRAYWQHTFDATGTFGYRDAAGHGATVTVK